MKVFEIILGPIVIFIWFIVNIFYMFKVIRKKIMEENKNVLFTVKCEKCNNDYNVNIYDIMSSRMTKKMGKSVLSETNKLGSVNRNSYYMAKKFYCPTCEKKTWSELKYNKRLIDINVVIPLIIKSFIYFFIGSLIIMFVVGLFI